MLEKEGHNLEHDSPGNSQCGMLRSCLALNIGDVNQLVALPVGMCTQKESCMMPFNNLAVPFCAKLYWPLALKYLRHATSH